VVNRVRDLRAEGKSYRAICETLHGEGLRPRRADKWDPTVVRRIATGLRAQKKTAKSRRIEQARAALLADVA
jgi:hypothetical protein